MSLNHRAESQPTAIVDIVPAARLRRAVLSVGGMTCASCVGNIETAMRMRDGIATITVNLITEKANVEYDSAAITPDEIVEVDMLFLTGSIGSSLVDKQRTQYACQKNSFAHDSYAGH